MERQKLYEDISRRTGGTIYIGVVGPVRTGKSTLIKRFMETLVLPECAVNEIADAVHQSNLACPIIVQRNFCGFFRHKFRLRSHDGSAGT